MSNGNNGHRPARGVEPTWEAPNGFVPLLFARRNGNGQKPAGGPGDGSEFLREHNRSTKPRLAAEKKAEPERNGDHTEEELIRQMVARHAEDSKVTPGEVSWETAR